MNKKTSNTPAAKSEQSELHSTMLIVPNNYQLIGNE